MSSYFPDLVTLDDFKQAKVNLIQMAWSRNWTRKRHPGVNYVEGHHVFPKSLYGKKNNNLIVFLTKKEHIHIHYFEMKIAELEGDINAFKKMAHSFAFTMTDSRGNRHGTVEEVALAAEAKSKARKWQKASEETRQKMRRSHKGLQAGKKHKMRGKSRSAARKRRIGELNKRKDNGIHGIEREKRRYYGKTGKDLPAYSKPCSRERKKKIENANKGEKYASSKLTEKQVTQIYALLLRGWTQTKIAEIFGVSVATVNNIKHGRTWSHLLVKYYKSLVDR